jgi:hypothetical protein
MKAEGMAGTYADCWRNIAITPTTPRANPAGCLCASASKKEKNSRESRKSRFTTSCNQS